MPAVRPPNPPAKHVNILTEDARDAHTEQLAVEPLGGKKFRVRYPLPP